VFNGTVTVPPGSSTVGVPGPFYFVVTLATPFLYDPSAGDLTIDTTHSGLTPANTPTLDLVTTAGVANAKRAYSIANPPAATAIVWNGDIANVLEFTYTPASGLHAGFTANVTSGASPLAVTFTDQSFSSAPAGITSWAWDFDGDNVIDSTLQNPTFLYTGCGNFNVSLTVTDATHPASTLTKTAYVKTDDLVANFTAGVVGPYTVQFTDTSSPAANGWAWDFNGDNIIDSTAQNPIWVYPNGNSNNVTLTATRNCKSSIKTAALIPVQQLTTNLAANNGLSSGATVYNDLQVQNPVGIDINAVDIITPTVNTAFTVEVYLKQGSYVGHELVPASWTLVGQATGTSNATASQPSNCTMGQTLHIPQGTYGLALRVVGVGPRYITAANLVTFGNGDLALTTGASAATYTTPFTSTSGVITPRTWSGTIYYATHNVTGVAGHGFFGPGCAGTAGVSHQTYTSRPILGGSLAVNCTNVALGVGVMVIGTSNTISGFGPLPVDLGFVGAAGCPLRVSLDATEAVVGAGTTVAWSFPIPNSGALNGLLLFNQLAVLDPAANVFGIVVGDAAGWTLGTN
jgi:PKD repeat protein